MTYINPELEKKFLKNPKQLESKKIPVSKHEKSVKKNGNLDSSIRKREYEIKKSHQKKRYLIISFVILAFFLSSTIADLSHYLIGTNFADERIQEISNSAGLNYRGKVVFFKNNPELVNADTLNKYCPNEDQNVVEYGCYIPALNKIYILRVTDRDFEEIEYNVAAHETLHAVFANSSYDEYQVLKLELDKLYKSDISGMLSIKDSLANYEQEELTIIDELHSFVGASLSTSEASSYLNDYYSKYFSSRDSAVKSEKSFNKKIENWASRLESESVAIDRKGEELDAYKLEWLDKIERYIESNIYYGDERTYYQNVEAYENNREIYNKDIDDFNSRLNNYNIEVAKYNNFLESFKPNRKIFQAKNL